MLLSRPFSRIWLWASLLALLPAAVEAQPPAATVKFCFTDWRPYTYMDGRNAAGISVDILRDAAARAGLRATFADLPWSRCLSLVLQGRFDAVVDSAKRPGYLQGPSSFSVITHTFWVRDDNPAGAFTQSVVDNRRIGLVYGYLYPESLLKMIDNRGGTVEYAADDLTNARKLAFGREEAMVGDRVNIMALARRDNLRIRPLWPNYSFYRLYPSFNPDRRGLQAAIDRALAEMLKDGSVDRYYVKHLGMNRAALGLTDSAPPAQ